MVIDKQNNAKTKVTYWCMAFLFLVILMITGSFGREEITTVYGQSNLGKATTVRYVLFIPFTTDLENSEYLNGKIIISRMTKEKPTLLESDYAQLLAPIKNIEKSMLEYDAHCMFGLLSQYEKTSDNIPVINAIAKRYEESDGFRARLKSMLEKKELTADFFLHAVRIRNLLALELVMSGRYSEAEVLKRPNLDYPWNDYEPGFEWPVNYPIPPP